MLRLPDYPETGGRWGRSPHHGIRGGIGAMLTELAAEATQQARGEKRDAGTRADVLEAPGRLRADVERVAAALAALEGELRSHRPEAAAEIGGLRAARVA